jgi:hypothetical protein
MEDSVPAATTYRFPSISASSSFFSPSVATAVPASPSTAAPLPLSRSSSSSASSQPATESIGGWLPLPPPIPPPFCKASYSDCLYFWRKSWYGVQSDLWSIGLTLFVLLHGQTMYAAPLPDDPAFAVLVETDRWIVSRPSVAASASSTSSASSGSASSVARSPLEAYLHHMQSRRTEKGEAPLSNECIDLLQQLIRIRPTLRPVSVQAVLAHPWFGSGLVGPAVPASLPSSAPSSGPSTASAAAPNVSPHR